MDTQKQSTKITAQEIMEKLDEIKQLILDVADEVQGLRPAATPAAQISGGGDLDGGAQTHWCHVHDCEMQAHHNNSGDWFSHKIKRQDGSSYYCKGKKK
jgi:hypothetical protein